MIGVIHSLVGVLVANILYFIGNMPNAYYSQGYFYMVLILMGIGRLIHGLIDYNIAHSIAGAFSKYLDTSVFTVVKRGSREESVQGYTKKMVY